jgi:hypothetical protein
MLLVHQVTHYVALKIIAMMTHYLAEQRPEVQNTEQHIKLIIE